MRKKIITCCLLGAMAPNLLFGTSASASVNTSNQQSDVNTSIQQSDAAFASANLYWDQLEFDESLYYSSPLKARSTTKKSYKRSVKKNWGDIVDTFCKIFDSATNFVSTFWDRITGNKVNPSYNLVVMDIKQLVEMFRNFKSY